jgi:hypothetical protein
VFGVLASRDLGAKHDVIARLLTLSTQARACHPDERVEPEHRSNHFGGDLNEPVVAANVRQLVSQNDSECDRSDQARHARAGAHAV